MFFNLKLTKLSAIAAAALFCLVGNSYADASGEGSTPVASSKAKAPKKVAKEVALAPGVLPVSNYELTTFIFAHPVKSILFPGTAPVEGEPTYLAGRTQVVIQFGKSTKPVQMVVALTNDDVLSTRVQPMDVPGPTHAVNGAKKKLAGVPESKTPSQSDAPRSGEDVELLKYLVSNGTPPSGFDQINLPGITRFDKFSVVPLAAWSNGDKNVYVFSLVAAKGQTAVVTPPQFYRQGITAVMVDNDVVDEKTSPQLFIVEDANDE